jgi:hypothetical protein
MANLKLKTLPVFPTRVQGSGGIGVSKSSGVYTIEPEWDDLSLAGSIDANNMHVWVRDATDGTYKRVALSTLIASITAPIFVQDDEPSTDETEGSIWIDPNSTDVDVYQLVSGVWTDTTANLKGPTGDTGPGYAATSSSSQTIGNSGTKTFTTQAGLAYSAGARVRASDASSPSTNWMEGVVSSYSGTTLAFTADKSAGSGTLTDWKINLAGEPGEDGAGTGDVQGPASSTSGNLASFNGTDGKEIQDSGIAATDVLVSSDIGTSVQGYDADTAKTDTAQTWTAKQTFTSAPKLQQALEKVTITADNPAATTNFDWLTQAVEYYTTANDTNWTLNVRGDGSTSLDSLMATGESITLTVIVTNTGTAYYQSAMTIDGNAVTPQWMGAPAPTAGTVNKRDTYTHTIIKTGSATFIVQSTFAGGN